MAPEESDRLCRLTEELKESLEDALPLGSKISVLNRGCEERKRLPCFCSRWTLKLQEMRDGDSTTLTLKGGESCGDFPLSLETRGLAQNPALLRSLAKETLEALEIERSQGAGQPSAAVQGLLQEAHYIFREEGAEAALGKLLEITERADGRHPAVLNSLGVVQTDLAEELRATRPGPNSPEHQRAQQLLKEAKANFRAATRKRPYNATYYFNRGRALDLQRGKLDEAEEAYRKALKLAPKEAHTLNNLAYVLLLEGEAREARELLERAARWSAPAETRASIQKNLGRAALKLGEPETAARHLEEALELRPEYPEALFYLARSQELVGLGEIACRTWRRYLDQVHLDLESERRGEAAEELSRCSG